MTNSPSLSEQKCPDCGATIPVHKSYTTWCDYCNWNLNPQANTETQTIFERMYVSLGKKRSSALFKELTDRSDLKPVLTLTKIAAFGLAMLVHSLTLIFAIIGLTLLILGFPNIFGIILGLLSLSMAWIFRPRFGKIPTNILPRQSFPTLYKLVRRIAEELNYQAEVDIIINENFNAGFSQRGWQRKNFVFLGLPLLSILTPTERLALLTHELAHGVNGDISRSFFAGTAIDALISWYFLLKPDYIWPPNAGVYELLGIPFNLIMLLIAQIPYWLGYLLIHLLWRDSQRAEYLADHLAATIGSTEATIAMLGKLYLARSFYVTLQRVSLNQQEDVNFFEVLKQRVEKVPARELERIKRLEALEDSRLDVTHPPTSYRINLLQTKNYQPNPLFTPAEFEQLEAELATLEPKIQKNLIDSFKRRLYY